MKPKIIFLFFDDDNVALGKASLKETNGELTGKSGDAFRLQIGAPLGNQKAFEIAKKISARLYDK